MATSASGDRRSSPTAHSEDEGFQVYLDPPLNSKRDCNLLFKSLMFLFMSVKFISLFADDPTVTDLKNPVKSFHHAMIVGDDQDGRMVFHRQFL
jgi:hypothetical protein